jgi:hypothetical protein
MVTTADIQTDLPAWPVDVIQLWLIEFANDPGMSWPPPEILALTPHQTGLKSIAAPARLATLGFAAISRLQDNLDASVWL